MELTLSIDEQGLLLRILEQSHRELLREIAHTDHREFRQGLLRDEKLLAALLDRVRASSLLETHG